MNDITRHMVRLLLPAAVLAGAQSCTVKEDRSVCPCSVTVVADTEQDCLVSFYTAGGDLVRRRVIAAADLRTGDNHTELDKGAFTVSVLSGMGDMVLQGGREVACASGSDCAPIWSSSQGAVAEGDDVTVTAVLQKQHAVLTLVLDNAPAGEEYPYDVQVDAPCSAMDLVTLEGCGGSFVRGREVGADRRASFTLTRQTASERILLHFTDRATGREAGVLDLSSYIDATGYSWEAEYLADILITIDFSRATLTVRVAGWEGVYTYRFVI